MKEFFLRLLDTNGASGNEENASKLAACEISKYADVTVDKFNNVIATFGNKDANKHILLDAHIDQIGMIVTHIDEKGFIKFASCGGIDPRILPGMSVKILGKENVTGIVSNIPPHLSSLGSDKFLPINELSIDTGMEKEDLEEVISIGDRIKFNFSPIELLNNRISSQGIDNRAGVAAIVHCAEILFGVGALLPYKVTAVFSSQEETSGLGARTKSFEISPDEALVVDVSFARQPQFSENSQAKLSKGPMIGIAPILSRKISNKLIKISKESEIPYQLEVMGGRTGTNADSIAVSKAGVKTGLISIPIRYMHTQNEVVDIEDVKMTGKLMAYYIKNGGAF